LTILQGFAIYVESNAEALRSKFVVHEGKQEIGILREDFVYGSPKNDWASVFPQFGAEIEKRTTPGLKKLLECSFSNTTPADTACSHITLMSICKEYFTYSLFGGCGIPWIELLGEPDDWVLLKKKAEGLREFQIEAPARDRSSLGLSHFRSWLDTLLPLLDHFVAAAQGRPDIAFWGAICNIHGGSSPTGTPITGWIAAFFPYLAENTEYGNSRCNHWMSWSRSYQVACEKGLEEILRAASQKRYGGGTGMKLEWIPSGLTSAPVVMKWATGEPDQNLQFHAGIFALHQHPDGALEPRTGWVVVEKRST
jgi:hypothetical protein